MTDTKDLPGFRLVLGPLVIEWRSLFTAHVKYVPRWRTGERVPVFERLVTMQETEDPWRKGHGTVIRLWPTSHAIMLGWWGDPQVDSQAGEKRALAEVLGRGTLGSATGVPVTNLVGRRTPEEIADKVADLIPEEPGEDEEYDFEIIDLRGHDSASG